MQLKSEHSLDNWNAAENPLGNATENPRWFLRCWFLVCNILPLVLPRPVPVERCARSLDRALPTRRRHKGKTSDCRGSNDVFCESLARSHIFLRFIGGLRTFRLRYLKSADSWFPDWPKPRSPGFSPRSSGAGSARTPSRGRVRACSGISRIRLIHSLNQIPCSSNVFCVSCLVVWRFLESRDVQTVPSNSILGIPY